MPEFAVIDAEPHMIGRMVRGLRLAHTAALEGLGIDRHETHRQLRALFGQSSFRRAWTVNGKLAAIGGVTGMLASDRGFIWLALTEEAVRYPVAMVKEARRQLSEIMATRMEVATTLISNDHAAMRFAGALGFHGNTRIPVGNGEAIAVGYHAGGH